MFGIAALAARRKVDELALTSAYTKLGEALGLDWAQQQVARFVPSNQWERLLTAGLARDFEQLRIDFLSNRRSQPDAAVEQWVASQDARIEQFRQLLSRARAEGAVSAVLAIATGSNPARTVRPNRFFCPRHPARAQIATVGLPNKLAALALRARLSIWQRVH